MNIAIVVGVSEYLNSSNNLPGCQKDAELIYNILLKSNKFQSILYINTKLNSAETKEKLINFIDESRAEDIEELFFYFTGHGNFYNDEFFYILSDYNPAKMYQTSLTNSEIDSLFRNLSPYLLIKVIDACQSGKTYIKESGALNKYFDNTKKGFNKCYFLSSSLKDQYSLQSSEFSDFTLSFINSIKNHKRDDIRYKDIMDYIADDFQNNTEQTPFFVIQADFTEKFCYINQSIRDYFEEKPLEISQGTEIEKAKEDLTLVKIIQKDAENYVTREQAIDLLNEIKINAEHFVLPEELKNIFECEVFIYDDYSNAPKINRISEWLANNSHGLYAEPIHKWVRKDRFTNPLGSVIDSIGLVAKNRNPEDYEWILDGFKLTVEVPYKLISIEVNSLYPNVNSYNCRIIYLISNRIIRFFYFISNYEEQNWNEHKLNLQTEWLSSEILIGNKEKCLTAFNKILAIFSERIKSDLHKKFLDSISDNDDLKYY